MYPLPGSDLLWKVGSALILFLCFAGFFWMMGDRHGTEKLSKFIVAQATSSSKVVAKQNEISRKTEVQVRTEVKVVRVKGDTIIKEVPIYVTQIDDSRCIIPNGFVRLHTAAAENTTAGPPTESDRAASPYTLSEIETVDIANLTILAECKAKLRGVINFYNAIKELRK